MLSNPVDLFDLQWRIKLLISAGVVDEQKKINGQGLIQLVQLDRCLFVVRLLPVCSRQL